jgi:hypothetical protein
MPNRWRLAVCRCLSLFHRQASSCMPDVCPVPANRGPLLTRTDMLLCPQTRIKRLGAHELEAMWNSELVKPLQDLECEKRAMGDRFPEKLFVPPCVGEKKRDEILRKLRVSC